jgi:putative monooxygenase
VTTTVLHLSDLQPADRGGGVRTWSLVSRARGATSFLNGVTEFDPGAALPFHWHNCWESVVVLEGDAVFEYEDHATDLAPTDTTWVPSGVVHRFRNRGSARMRIFWTYSSIDATRTIADTGQTFVIDGTNGETRA